MIAASVKNVTTKLGSYSEKDRATFFRALAAATGA
jgi:hypothetical protein